MARGGGKRAGTRRGTPQRWAWRPDVLAYAAGVTLAVVGWGFLVWFAIRSGTDARAGNGGWLWLAVASLGAIVCLFAAMMLLARITRALGLTSGPPREEEPPTAPAHLAGPPAPPYSPSSLTDTAERPAVRPPGHRAAR